jgi:hypothetical protein
MRKFLRSTALILIGVVALILIVAAFRPDSYSVSRSTTIAATPEKIGPFLQNFHNFASWSPWQHLDPNMAITYSGNETGPGAMYSWEGNSKAGKGSMVELTASRLQTKVTVNFIKPFASQSLSTYDLTPQPDGTTRVTWTMSGKSNYMSKVMTTFVSMDKMIGGDFDQGLANLKKVAER